VLFRSTLQYSINPRLTTAYADCSTSSFGEPSETSVLFDLFVRVKFYWK
jgi:hypothetical protein